MSGKADDAPTVPEILDGEVREGGRVRWAHPRVQAALLRYTPEEFAARYGLKASYVRSKIQRLGLEHRDVATVSRLDPARITAPWA